MHQIVFHLQIAEHGYDLASKCKDFVEAQIGYMLGDTGMSFVGGFGMNPPERQHHSGASCPDEPASCGWDELNTSDPNPHTLYGSLVGGPNSDDSYEDDRTNYENNEVATDYNAGFQSAVAYLAMTDCGVTAA